MKIVLKFFDWMAQKPHRVVLCLYSLIFIVLIPRMIYMYVFPARCVSTMTIQEVVSVSFNEVILKLEDGSALTIPMARIGDTLEAGKPVCAKMERKLRGT